MRLSVHEILQLNARVATLAIFLAVLISSSATYAECLLPSDGTASEGALIYNSDHKVMQYCNGDDWIGIWGGGGGSGSGSTPAGAVMAFDLTSCPEGWSEYLPARGRFVRGIDGSGGVDPDGVRVPGHQQGDANKSHTHAVNDPGHAHSVYDPGHAHGVWDPGHAHVVEVRGGVANGPHAYPTHGQYTSEANNSTRVAYTGIGIYAAATGIGIYGAGTNISLLPNGATEARPLNVALLYCRKD